MDILYSVEVIDTPYMQMVRMCSYFLEACLTRRVEEKLHWQAGYQASTAAFAVHKRIISERRKNSR
jgi:hypothetical protein